MTSRGYLVLVTVFVCCATCCCALKLPPYITPCSRNEPDINTCVIKRGRETLAEINKLGGDRKYNIPNLTPLVVTEINIAQNGLNLTFKNAKFHGIENIILNKAKVDFKSKHEEFELIVPKLQIICDYVISGRILVLPIQGSGPANITIPNLKVLIKHDYDLKKGKTGKEHMVTRNPTLTILGKPKGSIYLDNLFGNKELSDNMNNILNQNSEEVIAEVGPGVADAMVLVVDQIYNGLNTLVPFDEMYPNTV